MQRYISERLGSPDPRIVRKTRAELALAIRAVVKKIVCKPDRTIRLVTSPVHKIPGTFYSTCYNADFELEVYLGADFGSGFEEKWLSRLHDFDVEDFDLVRMPDGKVTVSYDPVQDDHSPAEGARRWNQIADEELL